MSESNDTTPIRTGKSFRQFPWNRTGSGIALPAHMRPHPAIIENAEAILDGYRAGRSQKDLALTYSVTPQAMSKFIRSSGVEMKSWADSHRKYALNQEAFDTVTDESAYWVGFLMADGCVSDGSDGRYALTLALSDRDIIHVEKFRQFLGSGQSVRHETKFSTTRVLRGKASQSRPSARLHILSRKLVTALAVYGVTPRKSHTAYVIGLEDNRHFWRGVIDGDGWITGRLGTLILGLVGSKPMMEQFRSFVSSVAPGSQQQVRKTVYNIYEFRLSGRRAQAIIRHLYADAPISLNRKQELADEVIQAEFLDWTLPIREGSIGDIRVRLGLNQREAAKLAGVHFTYWNMVERNHRGIYSRLTRETIAKFCLALDCDPESIIAN
jgi:DNA-binding Xre family transcriptional regulator